MPAVKKKRSGDITFRKFASALLKLARKGPGQLDSYLCCAEDSRKIDGALAILRCHVVRQDAHGSVRIDALAERLCQTVVDYAIPRSRIREAHDLYQKTGSTQPIMALRDEAQSLFTSQQLSGEGGELMLFWLTENILGLPQILCKMPLKTSTNQHYNGVDGVHAQPLSDGTIAMVWGEAKLYAKIKDGIQSCFGSIAPFVLGPVGGNAARRDLELLRDNVDLDNDVIESFLKSYLDRGNSQSLALKYRAVCLIGFNQSPYPKADRTITTLILKSAISSSLDDWAAQLKDAITKHKLEAIDFDFFFVPLPSVDDFRSQLRGKLGIA